MPALRSVTNRFKHSSLFLVSILFVTIVTSGLSYTSYYLYQQNVFITSKFENLQTENNELVVQLETTQKDLLTLQQEDQKVRNDALEAYLSSLQKTAAAAVTQFEQLLTLQENGATIKTLQEKWALTLSHISKNEYELATTNLASTAAEIATVREQLTRQAAVVAPQTSVASNAAPNSGYQRQTVTTDVGAFVVSLVAADIQSTRIIVDTASESDCQNDCPVLSLAEYVSRNGAFAGINGSYFCPATYPSCAGKTNSFDLLVMNKNKVYFNSNNNVYSTNPAVVFGNGYVRFLSAASGWGRDTGIDSMLSNYPLLISNSEIRFSGGNDPSQGSKSNRSFIATKGSTAYIGVVHGATVAESARALKALDMDNALNLDSGGSTALWSGGYKIGPGRNIPNAILFVRR